MAIDSLTVAEVVLEVSRMLGDQVATGTADAGSTSERLVDADELTFEEQNDIKGWVAIYEGTGIGDIRSIASSDDDNGSVRARADFSTAPDGTSKYVITQRWTPLHYLDAVRSALRRASHRHLLPLDDLTGHFHEVITLGDILSTDNNVATNGQFEDSAATFPAGWTIDGNTVAAIETGVDSVRRGRSSLKLTSDGTNLAKVSLSIKHFQRYADTKVSLRASVKPDVADRALLRVGDGGVSTAATATHADGADVWERLAADLVLDASPKGLDIDLEISAGTAVNAFFDDVRLIWEGGHIYEYDLPTRLVYLSKVELEIGSDNLGSQHENAWQELPRHWWKVQRGANPKLVFLPEYFTPMYDRHVRLTGQVYPAIPDTSDLTAVWAETIEVNAEYVKAFCKWYLLSSLPYEALDETVRRLARDAEREYLAMEDALDVPVLPGSEFVRTL